MSKAKLRPNDYVWVPHRMGNYEYKVNNIHRDGTVTVMCLTPGLVGLLSRVEYAQCVYRDISSETC